MSYDSVTLGAVSWTVLETPTPADIEQLRQRFPFHPLDLEDVLSRAEPAKLDLYPDYAFFVLHFPAFDPEHRSVAVSEVRCFLGASYLVVAHDGRLKPLMALFQECRQDTEGARRHLGRGAGRLLCTLLSRLVDHCFPILNRAGSAWHDLERELPAGPTPALVGRLSALCRELAELERMIGPDEDVLGELATGARHFLPPDVLPYLRDVGDGLRRAGATLAEIRSGCSSMAALAAPAATLSLQASLRTVALLLAGAIPLFMLAAFLVGRGSLWALLPGFLAVALVAAGAYLMR
jgi:magnesium transporter